MKTYILQKDLPGVKAGTEYEFESGYYWPKTVDSQAELAIPQQLVESNPDFFKLKEDEKNIEFKLVYTNGVADGGHLSKPLSNDQWVAVKSAIESVLNDVGPTNKVCPDCSDLGWVDNKNGGRSVCICHLT